MTPDELAARVRPLPRASLAALPTPLQWAPRLAGALGLDQFWIKRDDLTGLALGGNKSRGLELVLGDALDRGCDVLVAGGGVEQSNHAVQCAAAANRSGITSVVVLRRRPSPEVLRGGNDLVRELLGATTVWVDADPGMSDRQALDDAMSEVSAELTAQGRHPYLLRSSLHPLTVVGYVNAVLELHDQLPDPQQPVSIYVTSEGAALGGLVLGSTLLGLPWTVTGLDWRPFADPLPHLQQVVEEAAGLLGVANPVQPDQLVVRDSGGPAYGVPSAAGRRAMRLAAELEAVVLDPVYSAKGFAGMMNELNPGTDGSVVFVHTGGVGATFAYGEDAYQDAGAR